MLSKEISDAIIALMLRQPFYAHVLSEILIDESPSVNVAAVTISMPPRLSINPQAFKQYPPIKRMGIMMHEVLHIVMDHAFRSTMYDAKLFNLAADLAVNELIPSAMLPDDAATVEALRKLTGLNLPYRASAETYYSLLLNSAADCSFAVSPDGSLMATVDGPYGKAVFSLFDSPPEIEQGEFGELLHEAVKQLVERAVKSCGNIPAGLDEYIKALIEQKVDWRRILYRFLQGRGKMLNAPSFSKESKRFDDYPGKRKRIGMEALVAIDTSGSMTERDLSLILGHLLQIKKVSGTKIWIVWGDMEKEGGPLPIEKVKGTVKFTGRGGTDLRWPFKIADDMRISTLVYFTDGYGPAPKSAFQRVLWALTADSARPADYGEVVYIDKRR